MKYEHLLNREFKYGKQDCFTLMRDFYIDNFGITFPNYARPKEFWNQGLNLYMDLSRKNGFYPLDCHPSEYQPGDVILAAVQSPVGNHVGVFVENGQVLHHLYNRLSTVEPYRALLRNNTLAIMRHREVSFSATESTANLVDYLSPHIKRKIDEHLGPAADPV